VITVEVEGAIAQWKGTESAVLLPSGYQTNLAAIQALAGAAHLSDRRIRFLLDKLAHHAGFEVDALAHHIVRVGRAGGKIHLAGGRRVAAHHAEQKRAIVGAQCRHREAVAHRLVGEAPVAPGDEAGEVGFEI